ncbi:hypothetical protein CHS0354_017743 [Potamilus streckersoni]|uniref:LRAT domain-containing protein n=1 Tax=Potamilus streckersoni TaxID=2493646 RepID=A0AAE0VPP2_9BIVA|nr:hypothetical protein CHS0354_017743 [Potamilus streckersoni]
MDDEVSDEEIKPFLEDLSQLPDIFRQYSISEKSIFEKDTNWKNENIDENATDKLTSTADKLANDDDARSCANCSQAIRVQVMDHLEVGQHISCPGKLFRKYFESMRKQIFLYQHHCIIKEICWRESTKAELIVIHFAKNEDNKIKVSQEKLVFDLTLDELYVIKYQYPGYSPALIVQRAESILQQSEGLFKRYDPFLKNCEHFARWCVIGKERSFQVQSVCHGFVNILNNVLGEGSKIARFICRLLYTSTDEVAATISKAIIVPMSVLGGCTIAYLIYCIIMTIYNWKCKTNKEMCHACWKSNLLDLWLQFGVYGVTSAITYAIVEFALPLLIPGLAIPIQIILVVIATGLALVVPKIRKALSSPFKCDMKVIENLSELQAGDVVSLKYYGLDHLVIVSCVTQECDPKRGQILGIHYSCKKVFGKKEVAEEYFPVDLAEQKVRCLQLNLLDTFSAEETVNRAKSRVGEKKWQLFSNRSDHFCYWAKVKTGLFSKNAEDIADCKYGNEKFEIRSSLYAGKMDVYFIGEIEPGDVVEYRRDKGIVIHLPDIKQTKTVEMELAVLREAFPCYVRRDSCSIDLSKDRLIVHKYHPSHCVSKQDRVERALYAIDKISKRWTQTGFIEDIILKPRISKAYFAPFECNMTETENLLDVKIGDIVSLTYYGIDHLVIVTEVQLDDDIKHGKIRCIHYSLPGLLKTRVVAEEYFSLDLTSSYVRRLQLDKDSTFSPEEVVRRARSRVGERKWRMSSNRSNHLCYWAKMKPVEENNILCTEAVVHLSDEIQLGDVVKYRSEKGIVVKLVDVNAMREFDIDVVVLRGRFPSYGRCVTYRIDLNKDDIVIYKYPSEGYFRMEKRVKRALDLKDKECKRWNQNGFIENIIRLP